MTDGPVTPTPSGPPVRQKPLFERAKDIIMQPKAEWPVIDAEPATIGSIFTGYVMILAAIGPIAMIIGYQVFGIGGFGYSWKPSIAFSITSAVITYVLSLVSIYVLSLIIDALAPSFGGTKNSLNAFKVAAYSWTAAWLAAIFQIIPALAILAIVGLYSLYLMFTGLPRLMRVSEDKAIAYTGVVILLAIILWIVIGYLAWSLAWNFAGGMPVVRY
jgi:hypothetical protein